MPWAEKQMLPQQEGFTKDKWFYTNYFLLSIQVTVKQLVWQTICIQMDFLKYKFSLYHWLRGGGVNLNFREKCDFLFFPENYPLGI